LSGRFTASPLQDMMSRIDEPKMLQAAGSFG
jgi:hypothetical protein